MPRELWDLKSGLFVNPVADRAPRRRKIALIIRLLAQLSGFCFVRYVQGSIIPSTGRVRSRNDMGGLTPLLDRLFPQSSSASRLTAGASGFFTFNHKGERPRR